MIDTIPKPQKLDRSGQLRATSQISRLTILRLFRSQSLCIYYIFCQVVALQLHDDAGQIVTEIDMSQSAKYQQKTLLVKRNGAEMLTIHNKWQLTWLGTNGHCIGTTP